MSRREMRESAFKLVFESLFRNESADEIIELAEGIDEIIINDDVVRMFKGTVEHSKELDEIISKFSEKRQFERIPKVNIAVLRLALYEILYEEKVPMNVAINEAVLISKKYSHESDVAFVNGILGAYSRSKEENA
ncbi:MAG TPA: transcription antitermination factor NusB [Oscillospiraceae bacterium]|nr:transcription antitermination factor NusB [Oscillospiraceae bacterium]